MSRGLVLLLVEDDAVLGPLTAEALEMFGHAATVAPTAGAALHDLRNSEFDAVILDLSLGTDRGEVLIEKSRKAGMRMPEIVILSALPLEVLQKTQRSIGACGAIQKPIAIEDLVRELERCILLT